MTNFFKNEDGAVTVDWVVLTALIIGLVLTAVASADSGVANLTAKIITYMQNIKIGA